MSGTTISGQTHITPPVPRTSRVPISGSKTALISEVAAAWSGTVVTLSGMGFVSDASGGLAYGASPPSGSGQEVAINAAWAAIDAANPGIGGILVWDLAIALGAPIYYPGSNWVIVCPDKGCGAIARITSNCPLLRSPGTNANMGSGTNTASQNTFGKLDPSSLATYPGSGGRTAPTPSAAKNYRVFDPSFVGASNLGLYGGTWNHARSFQSQTTNATYGIISTMQFWGVDGLKIYEVDVLNGVQYHIHVLNFRNFEYGDLRLIGAGGVGEDGLHVNGPGMGVHGGHLQTFCGDDNLAFNIDDGPDSSPYIAGINIQCGGDVIDVDVEGPEIVLSPAGTVSGGCIRLSSTFHRLDRFIIRNTRGQFQNAAYRLDQNNVGLCPGTGNYGHVILDQVFADGYDISGGSAFHISGTWEFLEIKGRYRFNAQINADINIDGANIQKLHIEWDGYQQLGASNNTEPSILFTQACNVVEMKVKATISADASITTRAAPIIRTASLTNVTRLELHAQGDAITNLVDHVAGTIGTLIITGIHSNAGGGSPLAITSGATITNYNYSAAGGALAYVIANGASSGTGTGGIAHTNVYSGP